MKEEFSGLKAGLEAAIDRDYRGSTLNQASRSRSNALGSVAPRSGASPFHVIDNAFEESQKLTYRVEGIVNRLCGSVPEDASQEGLSDTDGVFDAAEAQARRTMRRIEAAMIAISRLEGMLP
jgi:hypothetical protein